MKNRTMTEPHVGRRQDARKADGLHLSPRHREKLTALLREHLPGVEVWAYGSRVNGRSHDGSDLDLVLRGPGLRAVPLERLGDFTDAVRESTLPFLVEARDWTRLPARFHAEVERGYVVLQHAAADARPAADEWPAVTLGDCAIINDATYSPKEAWPFIHYLDTGNVTDNRIAAIRRLVPGTDTIPSRARRKVQPGDVVYSTVRPDQRHFGLLKDPPDNLLVSTAFAVIRGKAGVAHTNFLYWFLAQRHVVERLHTIAEHSVSAYPSIRPDDLARLELRLPPLPEQRRIAHVLGTLDDKIALNRRLNATLEDMARALFKSWFVDFDPVHAKAALERHAPSHHSPRPLSLSKGEGESARRGRSPQSSRWGVVRRGYPRHALTAARTLRRNRTDAEGLLWHYLRNEQLDGYRFRRQHPIGRYIVDFACPSRKVLIELDGGQHAEQTSRDEKRGAFLRARGYRVLRFWNTEVFENCFGVLERVYEAVAGDPPPQSPAPDGSATATPPHPSTGSGAGGSDETGTAAWTVERVRAYLDGMDPEVAALFPDGFEDSVLGQIPKGWTVSTIGEEVEVAGGGTPDTKDPSFWNGSIHWATPKDMSPLKSPVLLGTARKITEDGLAKVSSGLLPKRTLLLSSRAPIGYLAITNIPVAVNQGFIAMKCRKRLSVIYTWLWTKMNLDIILGNANGSTFPEISKKNFRPLPIIVPSKPVRLSFDKQVEAFFECIVNNEQESFSVTTLCDTLLSKLLSGELQLHDAEKQIEDVG